MSEEMSGFRRSRYFLLKRQESGFTKTGSRTLRISINVCLLLFFRPDTIFAKKENYLFQKMIWDGNTSEQFSCGNIYLCSFTCSSLKIAVIFY